MRPISNLTALFMLIGMSPAAADTLAAEIWVEWQAQSEWTGQTLTADVTETETGLTLTNVLTRAVEDGVESRGEIDEIRLIENADGTMTVEMSDEYRLSFLFNDVFSGATNTVTATMTFEGLDIAIEGDAGARVYTYSADQLSLGDLSLDFPNEDAPMLDASLTVSDLASTYQVIGTDPDTARFSDQTRVGAIALLVDLIPPAPEPGRMKFGLQMQDLASASSGTMISLAGPQAFVDGVPDGIELDLSTSYERLLMEFSLAFQQIFSDNLTVIEVNYGNEGGSAGFGISNTEMSYATVAESVQFRMNTSDLPLPVDLSAASTELGFSIPLAASDVPQEASARIAYTDLAIGGSLWDFVDPSGLIPRNPASVVLDVRAQLEVFLDILDLDFDAMDVPPGQVLGLDIEELRLSLGGAELTGSADISFDPNAFLPLPAGTADLTVSGGNALLDALAAAGLLPPEDAALGRGMLQGFSAAGDGPDTRIMELEFDGAGGVSANGLPLPLPF